MTKKALVIGGGPAGLMAAEQLVNARLSVTIAEAKPTLGRKFLMAGKSGLNLTMDEPVSAFLPRYYDARTHLDPMITSLGPQEVKEWTDGLGQQIFVGTSGRVFPKVMKASPLLRAWIARLRDAGVSLRTNWKLTGLTENNAQFQTPDGAKNIIADVVVLAMGGKLGAFGIRWGMGRTVRPNHPVPTCKLRLCDGLVGSHDQILWHADQEYYPSRWRYDIARGDHCITQWDRRRRYLFRQPHTAHRRSINRRSKARLDESTGSKARC